MFFQRAMGFASVIVALHLFFSVPASAQRLRDNPCAGQGTPVGRKGIVTGCMCGQVIYELNSNSNPCWKEKPVVNVAPRPVVVKPSMPIQTPVKPEPKKTDTLLSVAPVVVPTATPTAALVPAPAVVPAKKTPPTAKAVNRSKPVIVATKSVAVSPTPAPTAPAPKVQTPLELEIAKNLKISKSLREQIRKNDSCPTRESDYDQIKDRVYDLIEAKGTFYPSYAKPFVGRHARWCAWNPEARRVMQGLFSCKNTLECSVKCVTSRFVPGMSINVRYVDKDRVYRMVGSSACVAWSNSWRDEPSLTRKMINAYEVGDLSFFPIGNGIYYAVVSYLDRSFADAMKANYLSSWDFYYVGIIYTPE